MIVVILRKIMEIWKLWGLLIIKESKSSSEAVDESQSTPSKLWRTVRYLPLENDIISNSFFAGVLSDWNIVWFALEPPVWITNGRQNHRCWSKDCALATIKMKYRAKWVPGIRVGFILFPHAIPASVRRKEQGHNGEVIFYRCTSTEQITHRPGDNKLAADNAFGILSE